MGEIFLWLKLSHSLKQKRTISKFIDFFILVYIYTQGPIIFLRPAQFCLYEKLPNIFAEFGSLLGNNTWETEIHLWCTNKLSFPNGHNSFLKSLEGRFRSHSLIDSTNICCILFMSEETSSLDFKSQPWTFQHCDLCGLFYFLNVLPTYNLLSILLSIMYELFDYWYMHDNCEIFNFLVWHIN